MSQYIEFLLTQHECVIVPGLGGFMLRREPAIVGVNRINPPQIVVGFNAQLSYHDGLLAEIVMRRQTLPYKEAVQWIDDRVVDLKSQLNEGHSVSFGKLGILMLLENEEYTFTTGDMSFLPDNLGLDIIHLTQFANEKPFSNDTQNDRISLPRPFLSKHLNDSHKFVRYAAAIAIVFIIGLLMPNKTNEYENFATLSFGVDTQAWLFPNLSQEKAQPQTVQLEVGQSITISAVSDNALNYALQNSNQSKEISRGQNQQPITDTVSTQKVEKLPYQIIIASLKSKKKANNYILNNKGFDSKKLRIIEVQGKFRISTAQFASRTQADNYIDSLRQHNTKAKNAWIYLMN